MVSTDRLRRTLLSVVLGACVLASPGVGLWARPITGLYTDVGLLGLTVTNLGYVGNGFETTRPSGEYPINSNVEHVFLGGLWVGARTLEGVRRVSTGAQDASTLSAGEENREFGDYLEDVEPVHIWSNRQIDENYNAAAIANLHIEMPFTDQVDLQGGGHTPLGLKVLLRAYAWSNEFADDYVILEYNIINESGSILQDLYVGYWTDTTIGNTDQTNPYDDNAPVGWNYYDDKNGAWGPAEWTPPGYTPVDDPDIWMTWERDDDGDEGLATSWIGTRLLGSSREAEPESGIAPVSYNAWAFRHVPAEDDWYDNPDNEEEQLPGKYQIMGNGAFTVGETQATDYTIASDWVALLSTGPFPVLAPSDTLTVTFAIVAGADSLSLLENGRLAQQAYNDAFAQIDPPPSPVLDAATDNDSVILTWEPGTPVDENDQPLEDDDPRRMPEHHLGELDNLPDFQGYRVYRFFGDEAGLGDPYLTMDLIAEFDIIDGYGLDTGLPPLDADGRRHFVDSGLTDGFPYVYAVTSYTAAAPALGLDELESGRPDNKTEVYPGPAAADSDDWGGIGVYPNPYRAHSLFDTPPGGTETDRRIWFTGLPARSRIRVFNLAGDLVRTIDHDDASTGQHEWDVLSDYGRVIASGLYIYAVEDLATGEVKRGKLVIIK